MNAQPKSMFTPGYDSSKEDPLLVLDRLFFSEMLSLIKPVRHGFTIDDLDYVEMYWADGDGNWVAGFVVRLHDGRRFYLGVTRDVARRSKNKKRLNVMSLPSDRGHFRLWEAPLQLNELIENLRQQPSIPAAVPKPRKRLVRRLH